MSSERTDARFGPWSGMSDRLFGEPAEVDSFEAEDLLKTAGIDPAKLRGALYQRMLERGEEYSRAGQPLPPLLKQALKDLQSRPEASHPESAMARTARLAIARLLQEIRDLPKRLDAGWTPAFTAAYRNQTELSARDKKTLDGVTEDLRKCIVERKTHE